MTDQRWLTVAEVAELLRVKEETVRVWLRAGQLKGVQPINRRVGWRIAESEVQCVLRGGEGKAAA